MAPSPAEIACIGMGANLGDAQATLDAAQRELGALPHTQLVAVSPRYRSAPVDAAGPDFVNAVAVLETALSPPALLVALQGIESRHGRERSHRNAPRTLDLDLLLYGNRRIRSATLTVPHPRLHQRAFALRPLLDVLPDACIPGIGPAAERLRDVAGQTLEKIAP
jgi:2-amino-4-hydroxy-6-hydroxymethyldihydropteridine diphosphokinase